MNIEQLNWDSHFFGIKIGKVRLDNPTFAELNLIKNKASKDSYLLLYLIADEAIEVPSFVSLVDIKKTYQRTTSLIQLNAPIAVYNADSPSPALIALALASGSHSRFKIDTHFPTGSFERLYKEWIVKSVNKQIADYTFVYSMEATIAGFVTLKLEGSHGSIGLLAVDEVYRGRGIGSALVHYVLNFLHENNVNSCTVATQAHNSEACRLYERCGFEIESSQYYYHLWL